MPSFPFRKLFESQRAYSACLSKDNPRIPSPVPWCAIALLGLSPSKSSCCCCVCFFVGGGAAAVVMSKKSTAVVFLVFFFCV